MFCGLPIPDLKHFQPSDWTTVERGGLGAGTDASSSAQSDQNKKVTLILS